jgi:hypothetical protein
MAPLAVDPEALDSAGAEVISVGEGLGSTVSTLTTALAGCHGMSGDDPAGAAFGRSYDNSSTTLLEAMATTRNGLCRLGDGVRVSAHNYSAAEAHSNISGRTEPLPGAHLTGAISAGSTPSSVGRGVGVPAGWGWVANYIGLIWPTGNSAKLRGAAAAWISAGTDFQVNEILGAVGPMSTIGAQRIPEGPAIAAAFTETNRCTAGILQQCTMIATHLTSYASKIDTVHAAIIDLLSRICNPMTGIKEVWEFLTDEDEDEIKKIANDIRIIVNQFTAEVDALSQQIATALTEAKTILSTMAHYAEKEWDHFLHATDVGRALDHVGRIFGGFITEAESTIKGIWDLNPLRAVVDPKGFWHSMSGALEHLEALTGLDGEHKAEESWKEEGKGLVHWDEWSTDPFTAAGESVYDVATALLPGGALSKLSKLGRLGADAAEAPKGFHVPNPGRLPNPAPHDNPPPRNDPPRSDAPRGGQPGPAPTGKNALPPYGVTESKTPATQKPAPITELKPAGEPTTTTVHAPSSAPGTAATPSGALPHSPIGAQTPGGAPSSHPSAQDHHGPVAHTAQPLTSQDLSALNNYTGPGHVDLNDALRNGTLDASHHARVDALNRALDKLPPYSGPVVRGTDLPADVLARYQPDAIITEPAFLSTSMEPAVAQSSAFSGNVEFRILSKTGRDISSFSLFPSEREVLFPNGTQFYVLDRRPDPLTGITIIEMIER